MKTKLSRLAMTINYWGSRIHFYTSSHMALQGYKLHTFGLVNVVVKSVGNMLAIVDIFILERNWKFEIFANKYFKSASYSLGQLGP